MADAALDRVHDALRSWGAQTSYLSFVEREGHAPFADPATLERLREVKLRYDPADLVRANHPVEPARG